MGLGSAAETAAVAGPVDWLLGKEGKKGDTVQATAA